MRFHTIVALDEPRILVLGATPDDLAPWRIGGSIPHPLDPDRWVEERQYVRNDARLALAAFRQRRAEVLTLLSRCPYRNGCGAASILAAAAWFSATGRPVWPATTTITSTSSIALSRAARDRRRNAARAGEC